MKTIIGDINLPWKTPVQVLTIVQVGIIPTKVILHYYGHSRDNLGNLPLLQVAQLFGIFTIGADNRKMHIV